MKEIKTGKYLSTVIFLNTVQQRILQRLEKVRKDKKARTSAYNIIKE